MAPLFQLYRKENGWKDNDWHCTVNSLFEKNVHQRFVLLDSLAT